MLSIATHIVVLLKFFELRGVEGPNLHKLVIIMLYLVLCLASHWRLPLFLRLLSQI
jgi:hypothetical protein